MRRVRLAQALIAGDIGECDAAGVGYRDKDGIANERYSNGLNGSYAQKQIDEADEHRMRSFGQVNY